MTEDLEPDTGRGFLQCETLTTNTATSAKKKSTFTSYYLGMWSYRHSWYQAWLQLRADFKLDFGPQGRLHENGKTRRALSDKPLDSSDATKWLQELLLRGDF